MIKKEFLTSVEIDNGNLLKLRTEVNGKNAYILTEDNNGMITANLYIWGPAYESYFLFGAFDYSDPQLFEELLEQDVAERQK